MYKYTKKDIVNKICEAAKIYQENLLNKNIMFVYEDKDVYSYLETEFKDYNFKHLTGVNYNKSSKQFFYDCLNGKMSPNNIIIDKNKFAFTYLKMEVLVSAMSIDKVAKRIGDYDFNKANIEIEKVVGNIRLCLGFSNITKKGKKSKYYFPKTLLKDKINNNCNNTYKVFAIFSKEKKEEVYRKITYLSSNCLLQELYKNLRNFNLIDFLNLYSKNKDDKNKIDIFKMNYLNLKF